VGGHYRQIKLITKFNIKIIIIVTCVIIVLHGCQFMIAWLSVYEEDETKMFPTNDTNRQEELKKEMVAL
jgi:hypothetical protein